MAFFVSQPGVSVGQFGQFQQTQSPFGQSFGGASPLGLFSQPASQFAPQLGGNVQQLLLGVLSSLSQLMGGWGQFGGQQQQQGGLGQLGLGSLGALGSLGGLGGVQQGGFDLSSLLGGASQGGFGGVQQGGFDLGSLLSGFSQLGQQGGFGSPVSQFGGFSSFPQQSFQNFPSSYPAYNTQAGTNFNYNLNNSGPLGSGLMTAHTDSGELGAYLSAQIAGGALSGNTTVNQSDMPGNTRLGQVADPTQWHAGVARAYAYQFAAQAFEYQSGQNGTFNPLSQQGLDNAAKGFGNLSPDAQMFAQVASVFKGNLMNGPGNYDNAALKTLLQNRGLGGLANQPQVGQTDVQTIGAITTALNNGQLSLTDILNSGAISQADMPRYQNIISYVSNGSFNGDLSRFDSNPIR